MALTNYTDLKAAVADWLNRADLTSQIPDFITLAEAKFNRSIRTRDMITRQVATTNNEFVPVPTDWLETYQLELPPVSAGGTKTPLQYVSPNEAAIFQAESMSGDTRYYTIIDGLFELVPKPATGATVTLTCVYYAKIPALSASNLTNWLLIKAPDLYLYQALANAAPYLNNDERVPTWLSLVQQGMEDLRLESERAMRSQTSLVAQRRGFN
jgi:hypothetical protein